MYTSPNKSLEIADLKRSLAMARTKSGRISKRRRKKRSKRSNLPKVVRITAACKCSRKKIFFK